MEALALIGVGLMFASFAVTLACTWIGLYRVERRFAIYAAIFTVILFLGIASLNYLAGRTLP